MPAPVAAVIETPLKAAEATVDPVINALHSFMLIVKAEQLSGLGQWVQDTRAALTQAEFNNHRLVLEGLHSALFPHRQWDSFPAYLDHLQTMDPVALRNRMLDGYFDLPCMRDEPSPYRTYEEVLRSPETYIDFLIGRFGADLVDPELEQQAYTYAVNPTAMQLLIVSHLRNMWDRFYAEEWARVEPMLLDSAAAFNAADLERMPLRDTVAFVTGRPMDDAQWDLFEREFSRLIFVPSAHVGPYLGKYHRGDAYILVFGARLPQGAALNAPDLSRNEIVVRLNALADDTRLRILRYIADHGEQRSQDIIEALDLSQSAASRQLKQLSATGYLNERRCEGAKCYSLDQDRFRDTFQAVLAFLAVNP